MACELYLNKAVKKEKKQREQSYRGTQQGTRRQRRDLVNMAWFEPQLRMSWQGALGWHLGPWPGLSCTWTQRVCVRTKHVKPCTGPDPEQMPVDVGIVPCLPCTCVPGGSMGESCWYL